MPSEIDQHEHCQACYDSKCSTHPPSCSVIHCDLDCGARFHACKQSEHGLLCSLQKVPCLNAGYGCPIQVQRSQMSRHLAGCPASLVHCTMEWNRWPVCSSERQSHQPVQVLMDFNREQLDIALALRDQRMLTKSMRASIRTRQILTNSLNRRHPAVPLAKQLTNGREKDFDEQRELENLLQDMHQWENATEKKRSRSPAGLQQSICDELYRASQDTVKQLSTALHAMTSHSDPPERPDFSLGQSLYPYIHCAHCERRKERLERLIDSHNAMKDTGENGQSQETIDDDGDKPTANQNGGMGHLHDDIVHLRVISNALPGEMNVEEQSEKPSDDSLPIDQAAQVHRSSSSSEGSLNEVPMPALFVTPSTTGEVSAAPGRGRSKILVVEPPKMLPGSGVASFPVNNSDSKMQASLSLDLSLESITRYQAKPDSMYTFLCAQVFRRDEFASHFQNVHSDIHGGLNGWLEQRCPLAPYGCTYSQRRLYPGEKAARIVHNEHLESFGIRLDGNTPTPSEDCSLVDAVVELEWVNEGLSAAHRGDKITTNLPDDDQAKTTDLESNKSSHLDFSKENGHLEKSDPKSPKIDQDIINEYQADQSDISLHAINQLGRSLNDDIRLNVENAYGDPRLQTQSQADNQGQQSRDLGDTENVQSAILIRNPSSQSESATAKKHQSDPDYLSQLPSELLRYLTRFLDAFSLCNLALTSKLLRQICCSILEERGMVIQHWEKVNGRWEVAYRVWHFSTAFTPILSWGFEDHPSLAVHLSKCPYNIKLRKTDPERVMIKLPERASSYKDWQEGEGAGAETKRAEEDESLLAQQDF